MIIDMKKGIFFVQLILLLLINTIDLFPQKPQLSLKLGAAKTFAAPFGISQGYAYKNYSEIYPYPTIAIEYSKYDRKNSDIIFCGISLQPVIYSGGFNYRNIKPGSVSRQLGIGNLSLQLYSGVEKKFHRASVAGYKNFFTWVGGLGLNINGPFDHNGYYDVTTDDMGSTYDGKQITGSDLYFKNAQFFIAPSIFTGFRYHIRNKKGKDILTIELIANYGITRYFDYAIQYKIDGQTAEDKLGEKGLNIQINVKIPLKTFGKKRKQ